jgi:hypothetical protein
MNLEEDNEEKAIVAWQCYYALNGALSGLAGATHAALEIVLELEERIEHAPPEAQAQMRKAIKFVRDLEKAFNENTQD